MQERNKIDKIPLLARIGAYLPYFYHFLNRLYIVKELPILTFVAYLNKRKKVSYSGMLYFFTLEYYTI